MKSAAVKSNEARLYHRITDFLPEQRAQELLTQILDRRTDFCPLTGNRNFLRLPRPIEPPPAFCQKLWEALPDIQALFGINLERPEIELYIHAYNDGTHFDRHSDAYGGGNWRRRISCVYYLNRKPRAFEGGNLVVYDRRGRAHAIEPEHNSAVFFPSHLIHEVLPVTCRSREFVDSRFAINVWIM
jgi:SM-20-related protein